MKAHQSVFNEYCLSQNPDLQFSWKDYNNSTQLECLEVVYEGNLKEYNSASCMLSHEMYCVATQDILYKFPSKDAPTPLKVLQLTYPRLEFVETERPKNYGFSLSSLGKTLHFFAESKEERDRWFDSLKLFSKVVLRSLGHTYEIGKLLGTGNYAKVYSAVNKSTKETYAVKSVSKSKLLGNMKNLRALINEIEILREFRHPRIINLFEVYEGEGHVHLVMEYLKGGELFDKIQSKGYYFEADASRIMNRLLEVVGYMHKKHVLHRDLKPENIMLTDSDSDLNFKLVDFGLAIRLSENQSETQRCGSPGYAAPEVLANKPYNLKADVFSCGIILYALLTGVSPFVASTIEEIIKNNEKCEVEFPKSIWENVSEEAKDLVAKMTQKDQNKRITAEAALAHPWFRKDFKSSDNLLSALENMKKYSYDTGRFDVSRIKPGAVPKLLIPDLPLAMGESDTESPILPSPCSKVFCFNPALLHLATPSSLSSTRQKYSTPQCSSRDLPKLKLSVCSDADFEDEIPEETKTPPQTLAFPRKSSAKIHQPFNPEQNEDRELPMTPGSEGGSKRTLADSVHLSKAYNMLQKVPVKKPKKRVSQFKSQCSAEYGIEERTLSPAGEGKEETVASETPTYQEAKQDKGIVEDGFGTKVEEVSKMKRMSGKNMNIGKIRKNLMDAT